MNIFYDKFLRKTSEDKHIQERTFKAKSIKSETQKKIYNHDYHGRQ